MQRYSSGSGAGVGNSTASARENARGESSFATSNFGLNQRRVSQLTAYKIKCEKEPLNCRLGPPDFYPQSPNCAEETLTREYIQTGYKETVDGIEEAREIVLTHTGHFAKPDSIQKCKEALSHHHKRLRFLSDQVPHGYRKKSLFEVLIRHNVPLLRATWFIKVTYLNQIRPASTSISSGALDKPQNIRTDLWTKDVIEYLQQLMDDLFSKDSTSVPTPSRDQSSRTQLASVSQQRVDSVPANSDVEEPSLQSKWWYMVRLLQWHYAEGLLLPSSIIEWLLNQFQV